MSILISTLNVYKKKRNYYILHFLFFDIEVQPTMKIKPLRFMYVYDGLSFY